MTVRTVPSKLKYSGGIGRALMGLTLAAMLLTTILFISGQLTAWAQGQEGEITGFSLSSPNPGELVVSWDIPFPSPTDYRVMWARLDQDYPSWKESNEAQRGNEYPAGDSASFTLTGLTEGGEYKAKVRARYNGGEYQDNPWSGPWSQEATLEVSSTPEPDNTPEPSQQATPEPTGESTQETPVSITPQSVPDPAGTAVGSLTGFGVTSESTGELTVSWDAPDSLPTDFQVSWALATGEFLSGDASNEASRGNEYPASDDTSLTLTGLTSATEYKVRMRARYDNSPIPGPSCPTGGPTR